MTLVVIEFGNTGWDASDSKLPGFVTAFGGELLEGGKIDHIAMSLDGLSCLNSQAERKSKAW
jgi:hypothetical protein